MSNRRSRESKSPGQSLTFEGFEKPRENWSKFPHAFIDALPLVETVSELKVILYILRHTWGYQEYGIPKRITLDEFANGRKRTDGSRLDSGIGLTIPSIRNGLKRATEHGFIVHERDDEDPARVKNFYTLNMRSGEKLLHPDCKNLSPGVKDSFTRTEKETPERNSEKEIKDPALSDLWNAALKELQLQMTKATYDTLLRMTEAVARDNNGSLRIRVQNRCAQERLSDRLKVIVLRTIQSLDASITDVEFEVDCLEIHRI